MNKKYNICFPDRPSEVDGFYLLVSNNYCVHSYKHLDEYYGVRTYQVNSYAIEFLKEKGIMFSVLN